MVEQCCVDGCFSLKEDLNYFKLPVSRTLRKRWTEAIKSSMKLRDDAVVCSRHFEEEQYMFVRGKRRLKPKVVPCVFQRKEQTSVNQNANTMANNETTQDTDKPQEMDIDKADTTTDNKSIDKDQRNLRDKRKDRKKSNSSDGNCSKSTKKVEEKQIDLEFSPNKDIEEIITNYHIKQTRPLAQISAERDPGERERESGAVAIDTVETEDISREIDRGTEGEREIDKSKDIDKDGIKERNGDINDIVKPKYVEISVGAKGQDASDQTNEDCLMLLENVQVELDPNMFPDLEGEERDISIEQVDLDNDSGSDCIDLGEKKEEPISLLSSSDEDEVIIQEPKIDIVSVSDATDEDDIPLLKLVKKTKKLKKTRRCEKSAAISKILANNYKCEACNYTTLHAADYGIHMSKHTHMIHMCELCNYRTSSWFLMHRHKERHNRDSKNTRKRYREKKYKCPLCSYRAKHNMSLVYHMTTHGKSAFECDHCGFFSSDKDTVAQHVKNCKGGKFSCDYCSYTSGNKGSLSKHLKRCHGDDDADFVPPSWS